MINFKKIKGILVDFDGVIADKSCFVSIEFLNDFLSRYTPLKKRTLVDFYKSTNGFSMKKVLKLLFGAFGLEDKLEEAVKENLTIDPKSYKGVEVTIDPYFETFVEYCRTNGIVIKVFSATSVERLARYGFTDTSLIYNTSGMAKVDYTTFLKTASDLGLKPEEMVLIDDGPVVLAAAKKAGLMTVRRRNELYDDEDFEPYEGEVDLVIDGFEGLVPNKAENL